MTDWKTRQNDDGGWAYSQGCSWTEPTAFVLLARPDASCVAGAVKFLESTARPDGGYSPQPGVEESTWVTALAALLPDGTVSDARRRRAIEWLRGKTGQESGWRYKLQQRLAGDKEEYPEGWPWFPGAAAWVIPTSLGILAFERAVRRGANDEELRDRIAAGKKFLLGRMCADGGWNHGSSRALGRDGDSYPETTGIALLALNGERSSQLERGKAAARKHLTQCRTAEGIAWLRMGLAAQGEKPDAATALVGSDRIRTNMDAALTLLAASERNPLLS